MSISQPRNNEFEVGWICAIATEFTAACELLDEEYNTNGIDIHGDPNTYVLGRIGRHKIVVACLPKGKYGVSSATSVAVHMVRSFPSIRFGLMVGIAGGAPSKRHDIRLGDIVVSCPSGHSSGVLPHQAGKTIQGGVFIRQGSLKPPPQILLTALNGLIAEHERRGHKIQEIVRTILSNQRLASKYASPGPQNDVLFQSNYLHQRKGQDCSYCDSLSFANVVERKPRLLIAENPHVHYGIVASADHLMKDAIFRDKLAEEADVMCFEMEAAGIMDNFDCLVIRGICDYADTHKNDDWQGYAAAVAAAYAKELLCRVPALTPLRSTGRLAMLQPIEGILELCAPVGGYENGGGACVVVIHGLGGHARDSWQSPTSFAWLTDWLARQNPALSILSFGYDSVKTFDGTVQNITQTAKQLLEKLLQCSPKRLVLICHGLGGVLAKVALSLAKSQTAYRTVHAALSGVVFLGTPQTRLRTHEWLRILLRMTNVLLIGNPSRLEVMQCLEALSHTLSSLSLDGQLSLAGIPVLSCFETVPPANMSDVIVDCESAILATAQETVVPLEIDHATMSAPSLADITANQESYRKMSAMISNVQEPSINADPSALLLQQLYCTDYENFMVTVPDTSPATGLWLFKNKAFSEWASSPTNSLFHLKAYPGYGKTVLTKSFIKHISARTSNIEELGPLRDVMILSYFFKEESQAANTETSFLRTLLHQILSEYPVLASHIQHVFEAATTSDQQRRNVNAHLQPTILWPALRSVLHNQAVGRVLIVIDALDEVDYFNLENICKGLVSTLEDSGSQVSLKIFATSRPNQSVKNWLEPNKMTATVEVVPEMTKRDIETFLSNVTAEFSAKYEVEQQVLTRVRSVISSKAAGMFLWASLAWDHFQGDVTLWRPSMAHKRLAALEDLPPGLPALYTKLLAKIEDNVLERMRTVFLIVAIAARPFTCYEAEQFLALTGWEMRTTDLHTPFPVRATIETHCASLLKVSPAGVIRAVHLSLKDFIRRILLDEHTSALHSRLARACIHYLTLTDVRAIAQHDVQRSPDEPCLMIRFGFYDYAATFLKYHMSRANVHDHSWLQYAAMAKDHAAFHTSITSSHRDHVNKLSLCGKHYYLETPLRHAIRLHDAALVGDLANAGYDLDEILFDARGTFVFEAQSALHSYVAKPEIFGALLENGASANVRDYVDRTPLIEAIRRGCPVTAKMLLKLDDVDVNAQDAEGRTALHYEATSSRGSILLNDDRTNLEILDKSGRTALTTAAVWGDRSSTIEFLRSARTVAARHNGELSILIAAAQQQWRDITMEVLEGLSDVSEHRGYDGKTILHWAVINDWEDVMQRAVTCGSAKVDACDHRLRTPLHEAGELGNFKLARKLLQHGATVKARDHQGRTPIQLAAIEGFADTVSALMYSDFDVNEADKQQRTLIHWAATWDWAGIMQRVLELPEAEITKHDTLGRTALHVAALCGCPNVFAVLLDNGMSDRLQETDCFGNTVLHLAARARSLSMVRLIVEKYAPININTTNRHGQTPLDVAIVYGASDVRTYLKNSGGKILQQLHPAEIPPMYLKEDGYIPQPYHKDWILAVPTPADSYDGRRSQDSLPRSPPPPIPPRRGAETTAPTRPMMTVPTLDRPNAATFLPSTRMSEYLRRSDLPYHIDSRWPGLTYTTCSVNHISTATATDFGCSWRLDKHQRDRIVIRSKLDRRTMLKYFDYTQKLRRYEESIEVGVLIHGYPRQNSCRQAWYGLDDKNAHLDSSFWSLTAVNLGSRDDTPCEAATGATRSYKPQTRHAHHRAPRRDSPPHHAPRLPTLVRHHDHHLRTHAHPLRTNRLFHSIGTHTLRAAYTGTFHRYDSRGCIKNTTLSPYPWYPWLMRATTTLHLCDAYFTIWYIPGFWRSYPALRRFRVSVLLQGQMYADPAAEMPQFEERRARCIARTAALAGADYASFGYLFDEMFVAIFRDVVVVGGGGGGSREWPEVEFEFEDCRCHPGRKTVFRLRHLEKEKSDGVFSEQFQTEVYHVRGGVSRLLHTAQVNCVTVGSGHGFAKSLQTASITDIRCFGQPLD